MQGLVADEEMNAIKIIKECTKAINPEALFDIKEDGTVLPKHKSNATLVLELLAEGYTHIGKKYRRGSVGPQLFDCSGFTSYIYRKIGIELFRTSNSQYTQGEKVDKENLKPGDLVFFKGSASRGIGHVGVVVSVDKAEKSFKFIHASNRGVIIDDFAKSSYYIRRYVGATRIIGYLDISKPQ
jgi:cell wall-associated NlpC family hydrolase